MGGHGHGASGCGGASAGSADALGASSAGPSDGDAVDLDIDNNNNDYYDDSYDDNDHDDNKVPREADTSPEDGNSRCFCLLCGVVRTNKDYGLGPLVCLPKADAGAPATLEAVEQQAPTFFALGSLVCAGGFSEADLPICFRCLR